MNRQQAIRVVHLTTVHPAQDTRIVRKEATTLARHGYEVIVIARDAPRQSMGGLQFVSLPAHPSTRRALRFAWSLVDGWRFTRRVRADIVHFHDPELIPIGLLLRCAGGCVVYDVHEDLPKATLSKLYIAPRLRRTVSRMCALLEWLAARSLSAIVVATPSIAQRFPPGKTVVVQNFPIRDEFVTITPQEYASLPPDFAYVGAISEARGIRECVQAIGLVPCATARLRLAGDFDPLSLQSQLHHEAGWRRVVSLGQQSRAQVGALLGQVRAGVVVFHPAPNHIDAQPTKLFEYMAAGLPVIASDFPAWRQIVSGAHCGLLVDPLDPHSIATAMQWILDHPVEAEVMGQNGRRSVETQYHWEREEGKLLALYARLAGSAGTSAHVC